MKNGNRLILIKLSNELILEAANRKTGLHIVVVAPVDGALVVVQVVGKSKEFKALRRTPPVTFLTNEGEYTSVASVTARKA